MGSCSSVVSKTETVTPEENKAKKKSAKERKKSKVAPVEEAPRKAPAEGKGVEDFAALFSQPEGQRKNRKERPSVPDARHGGPSPPAITEEGGGAASAAPAAPHPPRTENTERSGQKGESEEVFLICLMGPKTLRKVRDWLDQAAFDASGLKDPQEVATLPRQTRSVRKESDAEETYDENKKLSIVNIGRFYNEPEEEEKRGLPSSMKMASGRQISNVQLSRGEGHSATAGDDDTGHSSRRAATARAIARNQKGTEANIFDEDVVE
jgi:hypothetical protein